MKQPITEVAEPLWDRTLRRIRRIWPIGESAVLKKAVAPDLPEADWPRLRNKIDACLEGRGGEVSARARAAELGETYLVLSAQGRRNFLDLLAREYRGVIDIVFSTCWPGNTMSITPRSRT